MKGSNLALLGLGAGALYFLGTKAYNVQQAIPKLTVSNPRLKLSKGSKLLNVVFDLSLDINNPGSTDIPFSYYTGTLIHNAKKIADFNFNDNGKTIVLKARSKTPLTFQVNVTSLNLVLDLVKVITALTFGQKVDSTFAVNSSIYAGGVDIPYNFVYDVKTQSVVSGIGKINFFKKMAATIKARRAARHAAKMPQPKVIVPDPPLFSPSYPSQAPAAAAAAVPVVVEDNGSGWNNNVVSGIYGTSSKAATPAQLKAREYHQNFNKEFERFVKGGRVSMRKKVLLQGMLIELNMLRIEAGVDPLTLRSLK